MAARAVQGNRTPRIGGLWIRVRVRHGWTVGPILVGAQIVRSVPRSRLTVDIGRHPADNISIPGR